MNALDLSLPPHIPLNEALPLQGQREGAAAEQDTKDITESPSFEQLVGQLLDIGRQNAGAGQETGFPVDTKVISLQGVEIPPGPHATARPTIDSTQDLITAAIEAAPKSVDVDKGEEISALRVNGVEELETFTVVARGEKAPFHVTGDGDSSEPDNKTADLFALSEEQEAAGVPGTQEIHVEKEAEGIYSGAEKNTSSNNASYQTFLHYESSAVQQHTAQAAEVKGPASAEGNQRLPLQTSDLAEQLSDSAPIVKDGTRLAVKLEPEGLGKLDINVNLRNGMVHTQINVHDDATKSLIDNNMHELVHSLLKEGLSVGGFSVSLQKGDVWEQATEFEGTFREGVQADSLMAAIEPAGTATSSLVNIFV
jgi:hypothetical protein